MILWIILFILVIAISFVLALKSMKDYQEIPTAKLGGDFSLFLIRNPQAVNEQFLNYLQADLLESNLSISLERLFKGQQSAVVLFGARKIIEKYKGVLNLLELEDYTSVDPNKLNAWEMTIRKGQSEEPIKEGIFKNLPQLKDIEQFWWQIILWVKKGDTNVFQVQIRSVLESYDQFRTKELVEKLQNLSPRIVKLPKAYSNNQLIDFYKHRSFPKMNQNQKLNFGEIIKLVLLT